MDLDTIYCGECSQVMSTFPAESIDLVVTSPPYGQLRDYKGIDFQYKPIADQLWRIMKLGGVVVWVIGDETEDGTEKVDSCLQKIYFHQIGFNIHDTMIYERVPQYPSNNRYMQYFEYMFVFSKGVPKSIHLIKDKINRYTKAGGSTGRVKDGSCQVARKPGMQLKNMGIRRNIWKYKVGGGNIGDSIAHEHPAPFPEKLAADHIKSWSNVNDIVLDPMCGSGTTLAMAAKLNRHFIGIDCAQEYVELSKRRVDKYLNNTRLDTFKYKKKEG